MKKILLTVLSVVLFAVSCVSTGGGENYSSNSAYAVPKDKNAPEWINNPGLLYEEYGMDTLLAVGSGKSATMNLSEVAAGNEAYTAISEELAVVVEGMAMDTAEAAGYSPDRASEFVASARTRVTANKIVGARKMKRYPAPDGRVYVVYVVNQSAVQKHVANNVASRDAVREDELYAKFRSEELLEELSNRVSKIRE